MEIAAHIAEHNEGAASRFLDAAALAFMTLVQFPGIGAGREFRNPKLAGMRVWPITRFRKYLIFYLPTKRGIRVVRVIHGARDIVGSSDGKSDVPA